MGVPAGKIMDGVKFLAENQVMFSKFNREGQRCKKVLARENENF